MTKRKTRTKVWYEAEGEIDHAAIAKLTETLGQLVDHMPHQRPRLGGMALSTLIRVIHEHPAWQTFQIAEYFRCSHQNVSEALRRMDRAGVRHGYERKVFVVQPCGVRHPRLQPCETCNGVSLTREELFWAQFDMEGDCWLWESGVRGAYGAMRWHGRSNYTHRIAYEITNGAPAKRSVCHTCDKKNPDNYKLCGNPKHLRDGSARDNVRGNPALNLKPRKPRGAVRRTHCFKGHLFDKLNTYTSPNGQRSCKQCISDRLKAVYWQDPTAAREKQRTTYKRLKRERDEDYGLWAARGLN